MSIYSQIRTIFRGDVPFFDLPRELLRRRRASGRRLAERANLESLGEAPAGLSDQFAVLTSTGLLLHFRQKSPSFFPTFARGQSERIAKLQSEMFPDETASLLAAADRIVDDSSWELGGFGVLQFAGKDAWRRDPLGSADWGLAYHADVVGDKPDGPDIRVVWELNRFGHAMTLALAFAVTDNEKYAEAFFSQIDDWMEQNPYGRGANWNCAMEVALRSINLLAAFDIFRRTNACTAERLQKILQLIDQHGRFVLDNNEFSFVSTSNHYLSNVVGLFWIGTFLPELEHAHAWCEFGLAREMLREMDKQILPDGADFEASTGYHKFVTEMLLYSFLLADRNSINIERKYWAKLANMLSYIHAMMRPDGRVPLIGDADGSAIVPLVRRDADDQAYLLGIGAVVFDRPEFKVPDSLTPEVLWIMGAKGVKAHGHLAIRKLSAVSGTFPDAGSHVLRNDDLYIHVNTNDCGTNGRGSHAHNDALSIEISALGRPFVVDPGSCVYGLDREARHLFRSTAYHSTVMVDGAEQNSIDINSPFVMGNEARPAVLSWESLPKTDRTAVEHFGYTRLPEPIRHRRTVDFSKPERYWIIEDLLQGKGAHEFSFRFHLAPGLSVEEIDHETVRVTDDQDRSLFIRTGGIEAAKFAVEPAFVSRNYGHKEESLILKWDVTAAAPLLARFILVPSRPFETAASKLELMNRLTDNTGN